MKTYNLIDLLEGAFTLISNSYKKIITTFLDITSQKTVQKITISELMQRSNLKRETFYYYFDSKETLIEETLRFILFTPYLDKLNNNSIADANLTLLTTIKKYPIFFKDLLSPQNEYIFKQIYCQLSVETLTSFFTKDNGEKISSEFQLALKFYAYAVNNIIYEWIQQNFNIENDILVKQLSNIPHTLSTHF
ncbi:hypothetical protein IV79_GL001080 [Pediococcus claussenii]|nr:hypothetical protein IV79_GL001080 [Pediococcus claussenii]